ncbi:MAG: RnfABCDGE type electron transport complex subunit B [bacterium]|nr:RnfABCDGE type electron transport complex subunit B [bacterium]
MLESIFPSPAAILSVTLIGTVFGIILSIAKLKLKVDKDPRIEEIQEVLPGANCGACGEPGCSGYATKIVMEGKDMCLCPVGGDDVIQGIAAIMGVEAGEAGIALIARVNCQGGLAETSKSFVFEGPKTCSAANGFMGGFKACSHGCLGLGDCTVVCPFDAILMGENDLPIVDPIACTGCGNCVTACPRSIINLVREDHDVFVLCKNTEKAPVMKKGCSVGCIGCRLCVKACTKVHEDNPDVESSVTVESFLACVDHETCTNCFKCAEVCPVPVINPISKAKKKKKKPEDREKKTAEQIEKTPKTGE